MKLQFTAMLFCSALSASLAIAAANAADLYRAPMDVTREGNEATDSDLDRRLSPGGVKPSGTAAEAAIRSRVRDAEGLDLNDYPPALGSAAARGAPAGANSESGASIAMPLNGILDYSFMDNSFMNNTYSSGSIFGLPPLPSALSVDSGTNAAPSGGGQDSIQAVQPSSDGADLSGNQTGDGNFAGISQIGIEEKRTPIRAVVTEGSTSMLQINPNGYFILNQVGFGNIANARQ